MKSVGIFNCYFLFYFSYWAVLFAVVSKNPAKNYQFKKKINMDSFLKMKKTNMNQFLKMKKINIAQFLKMKRIMNLP